jgi:two-component system sensor histidine kinase DesK
MSGCGTAGTAGTAGTTGVGGVPRWARGRNAGLWAMVVWLPLLVAEPAAHAADADPQWPLWLGLAVVTGSFVGTALLGSRRFEWCAGAGSTPAAAYLLLTVQAAATVAVVLASPESQMLFPLLAIAGVVALDARWGLWSVVVATALATVTVAAAGSADQAAAAVLTTLLSGLACWSFRRLFAVIGELAATREELARTAVVQERERFSRDLHDLLGHTLSVIVVKAQAVRRIAPLDPAAAAEHAGDIEAIGRRALTEVRQAVDGYRGLGFAAELERARTALQDAGVAVSVAGPPSPGGAGLPDDVDALLGWVVREGVTNVVRHAGARACVIGWAVADGVATLEVRDDGAGGGGLADLPDGGLPAGGGLAGLRDRVAAGGGTLAAGPVAGGGFRLTVEVPVAVAAGVVAARA